MTARALPHDREKIPRVILRAMLLLVLAVLALVTWARVTDRPLDAMPPDVAVAESRTIHIFGKMDGSARVLDADGAVIADLTPDKGGFIAGMWRALNRERTKHGVSLDAPVVLIRYEDGRLALQDPTTGWRAQLLGFGRDNTAVFARLLEARPAQD
jgi:putative photosynthetic complex assembly protein